MGLDKGLKVRPNTERFGLCKFTLAWADYLFSLGRNSQQVESVSRLEYPLIDRGIYINSDPSYSERSSLCHFGWSAPLKNPVCGAYVKHAKHNNCWESLMDVRQAVGDDYDLGLQVVWAGFGFGCLRRET